MRALQQNAQAAAAALLIGLLAGCGGKPMPFPVPESEMPPAPGLFTGDTGTWDIPIVRGKPPAPPADPAPPTGVPK
jgi:hypothetical protein